MKNPIANATLRNPIESVRKRELSYKDYNVLLRALTELDERRKTDVTVCLSVSADSIPGVE